MNRDDVIRMAQEAGIVVIGEAAFKLCQLVAQHEREECAKACDDRVIAYKYATDVWAQEHIDEARHLAKAIRERGQE